MGHRANLIMVQNNKPKIYYTRCHALYTPNILAQGLNFCESFFVKFTEDGWLMDNAFAEGGILIDKDHKKVLIFGGDTIDYTPALQRHYCKYIIKKIWKGWSVVWCSQGNVDFAQYLNLMEDRILADGCAPQIFESKDWSFTWKADRTQDDVITIINKGEISDYKLDWGLQGIYIGLFKGEILKDVMPNKLKIDKWHNEIETTDCLLVDYDAKRIFICWGSPVDFRHDNMVKDIWKGWQVERQLEGLIFHFNYTGRDKSLVEFTEEQFMAYCRDNKLLEFNLNE